MLRTQKQKNQLKLVDEVRGSLVVLRRSTADEVRGSLVVLRRGLSDQFE